MFDCIKLQTERKRRKATTPFNESRYCIEAKRQERSRYVKNIVAKRERVAIRDCCA